MPQSRALIQAIIDAESKKPGRVCRDRFARKRPSRNSQSILLSHIRSGIFLKTSSLKDMVEIAGITAVVVSLIFVGLELRQSQKIAVASQYQSRIGFNLDFFDSMDEQDVLDLGDGTRRRVDESSASAELKQELLQMDTASLGRAAVAAQKILYIFDNNHYQYRAGFLDDEAWRATRRRIKKTLKERPMIKFQIVGRSFQWRESLHHEFQQILEEIQKGE